MTRKKAEVLIRQILGFAIAVGGVGLATFTSYMGAGGIIIAIGIAIASGLGVN